MVSNIPPSKFKRAGPRSTKVLWKYCELRKQIIFLSPSDWSTEFPFGDRLCNYVKLTFIFLSRAPFRDSVVLEDGLGCWNEEFSVAEVTLWSALISVANWGLELIIERLKEKFE